MQESLIRTLLINENPDHYLEMAAFLEAIPAVRYEITWCADYRHALEAMLAPIHDIILLDYADRPAVCEELLRAASAHGCSIPIVCLTEQMSSTLDRAAIQDGAADYVIKDELNAVGLERTIRYAIDRKQAESELARLAHYDALTGIPNRLLFNDRLDRALQRADRGEYAFALLYVDLDGFKAVNDNYGHDVGDRLVQGIAQRLKQCIRRTDSVARIGGDEFTVLLERVASTNDIVVIAQKIIEVVTEPFDIKGQKLRVGTSIGIAVYPEAGQDAESLLKHADMAMYEAKAMPGSNFRFFTEKMNIEAVGQTRVEAELRNAINNDELELYFQPRLSMRTGKIVGMEALLRWQHPQRGMILPSDFIPLAEQVGLIEPLGYWVLNQLCLRLAQMDKQALPSLRVSVNVSLHQFADQNFVNGVQAILEEHGISGNRFEFELAEPDVIANLDGATQAILQLAKFGINFALDDFGTGFSSLPQIQQLPFKALKLDMSHVQRIMDHEDSANIVRAMINLAHGLKLKVVAEGVETEAQNTFLKDNRCDHVQGYFHSEPVAFADLCKTLSREDATSRRSYLTIVDK